MAVFELSELLIRILNGIPKLEQLVCVLLANITSRDDELSGRGNLNDLSVPELS